MPPAFVPLVPWQMAQEAARSRPVFEYAVLARTTAKGALASAAATQAASFSLVSSSTGWNSGRSFRSGPARVKWPAIMG